MPEYKKFFIDVQLIHWEWYLGLLMWTSLLRCLTPSELSRENASINLIQRLFSSFWFVKTVCDENRHRTVYIMQIVIGVPELLTF